MAIFTSMPTGENGLRELYSWYDAFVQANSQIVQKKVLGRSENQGWEIPALVVTDRSVPDQDKQTAVVTLARHGHEQGARVVGPEILNYLASEEARQVRQRQTVVVAPMLNPEGMLCEEFNSSMYGITDLEKKIFGALCAQYVPDMMIDYHSLGKTDGSKYDQGDMEVIIPANTTKWGMDEQIHRFVAEQMQRRAEEAGWPYEIHSLEDLSAYYFGAPDGRLPRSLLKEKVFLLQMQNPYEAYDIPGSQPGYTNYTCAPAYMRWHTLVFGMETNHWAIGPDQGLGESGMIPCKALLEMGNARFPWEKDPGYPTNIICGDFRISVRPVGTTPGERRMSREKLWPERLYFDILKREMPDAETTTAEVRYTGGQLPLDFHLCLRMRQKTIRDVLVQDRRTSYETFEDSCSQYLMIPICMQQAGSVRVRIVHDAA
jgi:hypothetical protein